MDIARRIASVRSRLAEIDAEAVLVSKVSNVAYLTGLVGVFDEGADVACAVSQDETLLFTSFIYAKPARVPLADGPWELREIRGDFYEALCQDMAGRCVESVAIEASVPYGRFRFLSENFGGRVQVVDQWVEDVRAVKEPAEIERIAASAALTDAGFEFVLDRIAPGRTERQIALDLEVFLRENGSDGLAFPLIVAGGTNSANPHATVTDRELVRGDVLKMDFGARLDGYCSDLTRTVVIGAADERLSEMHAAVLAANRAGVAAVGAGVKAVDVDAAARSVIEQAGLGEEFGHGLGHGVGLEVHEGPRIGPNSKDSLRVGACVTIEPGVYVEGFAGVRIEDLLAVTNEGCSVLSNAPRELLEV